MALPYGAESQDDADELPGEFLLALAVFERLVADARHPRPRMAARGAGGYPTVQHQLAAIEALVGDAVTAWADILSIDPLALRVHLMTEAGLIDRVPQRPC